MHYAISTEVLGQTHMWYTQYKRSNFLRFFTFYGFLNFSTHSKIEQAKKDQQKQGEQQNLLKETYDNMWDLFNMNAPIIKCRSHKRY